jgi:hypothetical protein
MLATLLFIRKTEFYIYQGGEFLGHTVTVFISLRNCQNYFLQFLPLKIRNMTRYKG